MEVLSYMSSTVTSRFFRYEILKENTWVTYFNKRI
jgi:hypothetical protein